MGILANIKTNISNSEFSQFFKNWFNLNRWIVFLYLLLSAGSTIFYVNNVLTVEELFAEVRTLQKAKEELINSNKVLHSDVIKLQAPTRIIPIAKDNFGMIKPDYAPENLH